MKAPEPLARAALRDDGASRERLALERERLANQAKIEEMRLQLQRERVKQEMALQRDKIES